MSQRATPGSACARHPEAPATWVCGRCGSFMCQPCERRTRPEAYPLCPGCADLRVQRVAPVVVGASNTGLQTTGFVLGLISLLPIPVVMIASVVINIIALVKAKEPPASLKRWKSWVGLTLSCLSIAGWGGLFVLVALFGRP